MKQFLPSEDTRKSETILTVFHAWPSSLTMETLKTATAVDTTETRRVREQDYLPHCISLKI